MLINSLTFLFVSAKKCLTYDVLSNHRKISSSWNTWISPLFEISSQVEKTWNLIHIQEFIKQLRWYILGMFLGCKSITYNVVFDGTVAAGFAFGLYDCFQLCYERLVVIQLKKIAHGFHPTENNGSDLQNSASTFASSIMSHWFSSDWKMVQIYRIQLLRLLLVLLLALCFHPTENNCSAPQDSASTTASQLWY